MAVILDFHKAKINSVTFVTKIYFSTGFVEEGLRNLNFSVNPGLRGDRAVVRELAGN
jgi:hypothetical protein